MAETDDNKNNLAEDRTDMAEDRTLLANERTFAGWMRTGMAALGIGLGFHAIFNKIEPVWIPKLIASLFVCIGILIFQSARLKSKKVLRRLSPNHVSPIGHSPTSWVTHLLSVGGVLLIFAIWWFDWSV